LSYNNIILFLKQLILSVIYKLFLYLNKQNARIELHIKG